MSKHGNDKIWADAVRRAVSRRMDGVEGKPQKIERLADQLVEFALDGQGWAMIEMGNRLDGKPHQSSDTSLTVGTDNSLTALLMRIADERNLITKRPDDDSNA